MKTKNLLLVLLFISLSACQNNMATEKAMNKSNYANEYLEREEADKITRKLVKTGEINFETDDVKTTQKQIDSLIKKYMAYISNEELINSYNRTIHHITVKIPIQSFDDFVYEIENNRKIDNKSINVKDVTEQFIDITTRLKTKKRFEKRYLNLLEKSKNVDEILAVQKQLEILQSDIEAIEASLKLLNNKIAYAVLEIRFYKTILNEEKGNVFIDSIKIGWRNFTGFLGLLIKVWPFIILLTTAFFYRKRILIFRKNKK